MGSPTPAIVLPFVMLAWLIVTEWIPMPPLNDLTASTVRERASAAVINYGTLMIMVAGIASGTVVGAIIAAGLAAMWVVGHIASWWLPYFGISSQTQRDAYQHEFANTMKVLPTAGHAVVPDVQHMVVGAIMVPMVISIFAAAATTIAG